MKKLSIILLSLLFCTPAFAGNVSFDQLAVSNDLTVAKYNKDMGTIYVDHNGNIDTSNIKDGTLLVGDFDSSSSPQVRTDEGAACDFVNNGLIDSTTSGTLTGNTSAGTAYPVGYRINKSSATPHTYTASKWTFVDLDFNGNFQYQAVSIGGATPSVSANSLRLERVSTDGTQIANVQDLRKTSCASGPFSVIQDTVQEDTLSDILTNGSYVRKNSMAGRTPQGLVQGFFVSYDTQTTFRVTPGVAYINGKYRSVSVDTVVPQTLGVSTTSTAGLDTGAVGSSLTYNIFVTADQPSVNTAGVIFSTGNSPTGVTNSRLIGSIRTDSASHFTSQDNLTIHGVMPREVFGAWVNFAGNAGIAVRNSYNLSSITRDGTGQYTIAWKVPFTSGDGFVVNNCGGNGAGFDCEAAINSTSPPAPGSIRIAVTNSAKSNVDTEYVEVGEIGEKT